MFLNFSKKIIFSAILISILLQPLSSFKKLPIANAQGADFIGPLTEAQAEAAALRTEAAAKAAAAQCAAAATAAAKTAATKAGTAALTVPVADIPVDINTGASAALLAENCKTLKNVQEQTKSINKNTAKKNNTDLLTLVKKIAGQLLKKLILDRLVDAIIKWINEGGDFGGVIENWEKEISEKALDEAIGEVIFAFEKTTSLCSGLDVNLMTPLLSVQKFSQRATCTLGDIEKTFDKFVEKFENGGWVYYNKAWEPTNNFYGNLLMAAEEIEINRIKKEKLKLAEAQAGSGFLSFQKCKVDRQTGKEDCRITTPGGFIAQSMNYSFLEIPTLGILNADDIATYITAIIDAAINRLAKLGIEGLKGAFKPSRIANQGPPPSWAPQKPPVETTALSNFDRLSAIEFRSNSSTALNSINNNLGSLREAQKILTRSIELQQIFVESLAQLAACKSDNTAIRSQFFNENDLLKDLNRQFNKNEGDIRKLENAAAPAANVTPGDYYNLILRSDRVPADPEAASDFLTEIQSQGATIQVKVDSQQREIQDQLPC